MALCKAEIHRPDESQALRTLSRRLLVSGMKMSIAMEEVADHRKHAEEDEHMISSDEESDDDRLGDGMSTQDPTKALGSISLSKLTRADSAVRRSTLQLSKKLEQTSSMLSMRISESLHDGGAGMRISEDGGTGLVRETLSAVADNSTDSEEDEEVRVVGGGETLPEGWTEQKDPDSGHPYYYNHARKQSMWEKPQLPA
jgi:hypothetical protein